MYTRRYRPQYQSTAPSGYTQPRHHEFSPYAAEQSFHIPPQYPPHDDYYFYEQPSEFDELAYEEERLIEAQRQIEAQRRRIAEERRRVARAAEYKRYQEYQAQQEAERRAQWLYQQRIAQQQQQQQQAALQRKRQAAAIKEAQLEAALRELEYRDASERRRPSERRQIAQEVVNPLELLLGLFSPSSQKETAQRTAPTYTSRCAQRCARPQDATANLRAELPSSSNQRTCAAKPASSKPASPKPAAAPSKPTIAATLKELQSRIDAATQNVAALFSTDSDKLTTGQFGKLDSELMNILLALDNVSVDSEEAREARKALVKETVSLLERVDQRKADYSASSSEVSAEESVLEESDHEEKKQEDEIVGEIDADSEGSVVETDDEQEEEENDVPTPQDFEDAAPTSEETSEPSTSILPFAFETQEESAISPAAEVLASVAASANDSKTEEVAEDLSALVDFADSFADVKADAKIEDEKNESNVEEDPFGLKALRSLSQLSDDKQDEPLEYQAQIPIKNNSKASVTIEAVPVAS